MWRSVSEKSISWISTPQILSIFILPRLSGLIQKSSGNQMSYLRYAQILCLQIGCLEDIAHQSAVIRQSNQTQP